MEMFNDYDLKNRLNNIMWTISGNYNEEIEGIDKYADYSKDLAIYYAVKTGARQRYVDWNLIKRYIVYKMKNGVNPDIMIPFVEICADILVEDKLIQERPGITDIRNRGFEELLERFLTKKNNTLIDKVRYAWVFEQMGKSVQFDNNIKNILKDMKRCKEAKDTKELIKIINNIFTSHFNPEDDVYEYEENQIIDELEIQDLSSNEENDFSDFLYEELFKDSEIDEGISDRVDQMSASLLVESLGELSKVPDNNINKKVFIDEETAKKIYDKISYYYGKPYISEEESKNIERKICKNVHDGCRVHFTDGVLRTNCDNAFQTKYVSRQKENNLSYYAKNPRVNKRNIVKLKQLIQRTMTAESEITTIPADNGVIVSNKLWRIGRTRNNKVFNKVLSNEKGGYVVDILLDGSGSQRINQGRVATQAFIISEALTLAKIPNRVMGFSSFLDYTILRRYRDYNSPISDNRNIFEYYSAGNNRDGLAIQAVCEGIIKRNEENKIVIVLSDGKPNDIIISKTSQRKITGQPPYKGATAIKDTALEVRKARKQGILVLGVFTGKEEDLFAEKYIYGKDFIYTRSIDRFSDIVGTFLKRVIENY
ncbi:nitric oxide reductase activation-like protein [Alkalibaculum sp. M08DMB]|uniref:Nitric oxide reductase activation-like protein n=1 Tax=Alkalibaculum sporogenes TaxID=2655001 RepID=A0A6A7K6K3_9FIRM|nr:nitric oxide reductase activation-like protein [Alkalibaculum sporogenes]MPW25060.1 nitric oxide reductase activation-like protein [Alkalibaculum sporogenes]